ncbi:MAG: methyltransferase domain-containing protein, partial [Paracoccaceae bacterium]|jgi:trans-aconitate methyltransferase
MRPEDILTTYSRVAGGFARHRDKTLFERPWLDRMLSFAVGRQVLDLGCGPGKPIAAYLTERRAQVTGVDGAPEMIALFRAALPNADAIEADMRGLALGRRFNAILAWNSFFHLSADDQRAMFPVFAAHSEPRAVLMFTSGQTAGEAVGEVEGESVYHASLAPEEYRELLTQNGFSVIDFVPEDPACRGHSVWLARFDATA